MIVSVKKALFEALLLVLINTTELVFDQCNEVPVLNSEVPVLNSDFLVLIVSKKVVVLDTATVDCIGVLKLKDVAVPS